MVAPIKSTITEEENKIGNESGINKIRMNSIGKEGRLSMISQNQKENKSSNLPPQMAYSNSINSKESKQN